MAEGIDFQTLADHVGKVLGTEDAIVRIKREKPAIVRARSLFGYWAVWELGCINHALAGKLGITQPAVCIAVRRGERIAAEVSSYQKTDR